jgi:hypothetical protein
MPLTIELTHEAEKQLSEIAAEQGVPPGELAQTLFQRALQRERNEASIAVLNGFLEGDGDEQAATWQALETGLADSRRRTRKE